MNYAKNIRTGELVNADEVKHRRGFICPKCHKSVFHRRKSTHGHKPHFAHKKGEGTIECENYCPSQEKNKDYYIVATPPEVSQSNSQKLTKNHEDYSFHLDIVLPNPTSKTPNWYLAIAFVHYMKTGSVIIKEGLRGSVHVPLTISSALIPVTIQNQDYQIEISGNDVNKGTEPLSGLTLETGNLFSHKGDRGRRLANHESLSWGEQYFLVWHRYFHIEYPNEIIQRTLISQENWECAEIQLPPEPSKAISTWVQRYLKKKIQTPAIMLSLVTPPYSIHENAISIKDTDEVVVAITEQLGNYISGILAIKQPFLQKAVNFAEKSPVLIDLGRLTPGKTELRLNSSSQSLVLNCTSYQENHKLPSAISLTFQNNLTVPAYSMKIYECLQTRQHNPLVGIDFPTPMRFWIWTKSKNDSAWQIIAITTHSEESLEDFQNRTQQAINEVIEKKEQFFIQLDFEHFGQPLIQQPTLSLDSESRLPNDIIHKIQLLTNLSQVDARINQQTSGEGMRMLKNISQSEELKKYLQKMNRTNIPTIVEPYLRILAKKLKI